MNKELKGQWIKDLRSGEFMQGSGYLKYYNEYQEDELFCCLGVLGLRMKLFERDEPLKESYLSDLLRDQEMPFDEEMETKLAGKNDNGYTFKEIANYIEENIPEDE